MRIETESIFEEDGKKYIPTYRDGKLWANWEFSGNAPDDTPGVSVPEGFALVSGSVKIHRDEVGPMMRWNAISDDKTQFMQCKDHFE